MSDPILNVMRTPAGDAACREAGIDPDANPATAAMTAVMVHAPEVHYLARVLPAGQRGCDWPGRFDHEDNGRHAGFGPAPGEGECDYPQGCDGYGDAGYRCPFQAQTERSESNGY